ncbi:hypothetical protein EX30DRAFT_340554 [Ascodesmis nigricans]|uniref:Uncharacterized protein n=1 Tax=Ascodesmis nigricans TaxID=341454 RepID=A0A4S2MYJ1_9PEZI|nr:hypothetical protein EX30DRAFT_340554 [Ascodesmis nigricans]
METAGIIGIVMGAVVDIVSARVEITAVLKKIERIEYGLRQHFAHIRPGHSDYAQFQAEADDIRKYIRDLRSMIGCGDRSGPSGGDCVKWAFMNKAGVLMMIEDLESRYQGLDRFHVSRSRLVAVKKVTPDSELRTFSPRYRAALIKAHQMYFTQSDTTFCVSLEV